MSKHRDRWPPPPASPLEIWGGLECSSVRTAAGQYDQLTRTGHASRDEDLERLATLGLRTLRYPVLWERHAENPIDWRWSDRRLGRLRELGIRPIVGLLHHGCGPLPGGFLDPDFVSGLQRFARAVAERYPWIDAYTPINEPLTTARFSGLYGFWHPFHTDNASFAKIFMVECRAIRAAMKAIREVNPTAQLIQTEDVGKTYATESLAYQADWENERRWLTFDLLAGRLNRQYPLWAHLHGDGISEGELHSFLEDPCSPDILGMNHYVTGERILDDQLENYPPVFHGGNGRHTYADIPAARARAEGVAGFGELLRELWNRFHIPIALTEVQLACTREEQLRWLSEAWNGALCVMKEGADIRAVTAWALLGAYDWDTLLMESRGHYESGAFDARTGELKKTAVAYAVQRLAETGEFYHPALAEPGWWRRSCRLLFPPVSAPSHPVPKPLAEATSPQQPILLIGPQGRIARHTEDLAYHRGLEIFFAHSSATDDFEACRSLLDRHKPWAVIVLAGTADDDLPASDEPPSFAPAVRALEHLCKTRCLPLELFAVGRSVDDPALAILIHAALDRLIDASFPLDQLTFEPDGIRIAGT